MKSSAKTVAEYMQSLPAEKRAEIEPVLDVIRKRIPPGYEEGMLWGMACWYIPLSVLPDTYNGQPLGIVALGSQKNYNAVYLMGVYGHTPTAIAFREAFAKAGKKLDMGKSCVRFKRADDLALDAVGDVVAGVSVEQYMALYRQTRADMAKPGKAAAKKPGAKKARAKKAKKKAPAKKKAKRKAA